MRAQPTTHTNRRVSSERDPDPTQSLSAEGKTERTANEGEAPWSLLKPTLNDAKHREALQAGAAEVFRRASESYRSAKKQVNETVEAAQDWLQAQRARAAAKVKAEHEALNQPAHPLRQKIAAANAAVDRLERVVKLRGCLCREETSVPQGPGPSSPSQLCVLRSGISGQAKAWIGRYHSDCTKDCARWTADAGYTDLCATASQRQSLQSDLAHAKEGAQASERALSETKAIHERALERLTSWKPFKG
jgi:hypothetical protein